MAQKQGESTDGTQEAKEENNMKAVIITKKEQEYHTI